MTVIAFDLSLSNTGIAIFDDTGQCKELISIDTHKEKTHPLKLRKIELVMKKIKRKYKPRIIVIEESFTRFNKSTQAIYKCRGITDLIFYDIPQVCFHATSVRKELLGRGNAKKEELQRFILDNYKDISFEDMDQSDAFGVGICYFKKKGGINVS